MHVERPDRLKAIVERLEREELFSDVRMPSPATLEELRRVHRTTLLEFFENLEEGFLDPETAVHPETWGSAPLAAGAAIPATREASRRRKSSRKRWSGALIPLPASSRWPR